MRRKQERRNSDMYSARVHGPPRCGGSQDARACRVGGGQGDGGDNRAPVGGRFAGRAPGRPQYGYGPRDRSFEEVTMHHAFLVVVVVSLAVDGTGDTLCLILLILL